MNSQTAWQFISHYSYVLLSVIGVVIVLALVYRDRLKKRSAYGQREFDHENGEEVQEVIRGREEE